MPVGTGEGRADGGSNAVERNLHANRSWICSSEERGYSFDCWTPEEGLSRGYTYGRIEDARYARNVEIRSRNKGRSDQTIALSHSRRVRAVNDLKAPRCRSTCLAF